MIGASRIGSYSGDSREVDLLSLVWRGFAKRSVSLAGESPATLSPIQADPHAGICQAWMPTSLNKALIPFQPIPTPIQSMMNAESLTRIVVPTFPILSLTRWAYR